MRPLSGLIPISDGRRGTSTISRAPVYSRSFDHENGEYVRDQCDLTVSVKGKGIHLYIRPNNNQTGAEHYVTHVTGKKPQGQRIGE